MDSLCETVFADVEYILHAGDIEHPDLLFCFDRKPLLAVRGNCDEAHPELPEKRILELRGVRIGLIHGWGAGNGIVKNVLSRFTDEDLDVLVFGHSHYPLYRQNGDIVLFNPGSATERRNAPFHSVGILELNDSVTGTIVNIDS